MDIIPVIDVRGGQAVRAIAGDRANYQSLVSPLVASSDPLDVAAGLMALYPFPVIYVADLDGIEGRGEAMSMIRLLASTHAGTTFWVDNGARTPVEVDALLTIAGVCAVIGSETEISVAELRGLTDRCRDRIILSLDFRPEGYVGDRALTAHPDVWPSRVIVMTLGVVGRSAGPDLTKLAEVRALNPAACIYAAGGIRDIRDLDDARAAGANGALIASALHAQTITADDLSEVTGRCLSSRVSFNSKSRGQPRQ